MLDWSIYLLTGALAGTAAGLFGIGGGMIIVPVLLLVFELRGIDPTVITHLAIGTSVATVVITTAGSARGHYRLGAVDTAAFLRLAAGMIPAAAAGSVIAGHLPGEVLQQVFGVFLLLVSLYMLSGWQPRQRATGHAYQGLAVPGAGVGLLSTMLGIGGGVITVPYLLWRGVAMHRAVGTSAATAVPLSLAGTLGYLVAGWGQPQLPAGATGYLYWPAFLGVATASLGASSLAAHLAHRIPARRLRRLFSAVLLLVALRLLLS
ncbi:MAG: sulfite exporter TauE/SafE family protein [Halorhodospira sp.]